MTEVSAIGLNIAKSVFQTHGADAAGRQLFCQRLLRAKAVYASQSDRAALLRSKRAEARIIGRVSLPRWAKSFD